jgi:hypothetical protein
MKKIIVKNLISIGIISILFVVFIVVGKLISVSDKSERFVVIKELQEKYYIDIFDEEQVEIFKIALESYPIQHLNREKFENLLDEYKRYYFTNPKAKEGYTGKNLSLDYAIDIMLMFVKFCFIYFISFFSLYHFSKAIGFAKLIREINYQNDLTKFAILDEDEFLRKAKHFKLKKYLNYIISAPFYLFIFSPSYVAAYAIRSKFDSDSFLFLIFFAIFTNGALLYSGNRFYNMLKNEYHKGYALTALVKNLKNDYSDFNFLWLFSLSKKFKGSVLGSIYPAALSNFYLSLKEIGSFLITSLAIIEMALNIQNFFCYELLKCLLFEYYDSAFFIIFLLFVLVKANDIAAEILHYLNSLKYES